MIFVVFIITISYCILIGSFIIGFDKVEAFDVQDLDEKTNFSVIIPFRNEAENLPDLLKSINKLDYPEHLFEILLIDDASEDNSVEIINSFVNKRPFDCAQGHITIINNKRISNSPKKDAITTAIHFAKNDWIVTTDADCIVPEKWLKTLDAFIQTKSPKMIIAPVTYSVGNTFFEHFQLLDFLSLQSATIAGFGINKPFLCNGANLAYKKELFKRLNGFEGNTKIASGDDIFLMEKALQTCPENIKHLKSKKALVFTKPQASIKDLVQQRLRWAAKAVSYNNTFGKRVGLIILSMNALIIVVFFLTIIGALRFELLILIFATKFFLDVFLIYKSAHFFNQHLNSISYILSSLLYPVFSVYIAVSSMFFGFKWKDRAFKK